MISICCAAESHPNWIPFAYMIEIRMIGTIMGDEALKTHLCTLSGLKIIRYVPESSSKAIIEFEYRNHHFSVDNGFDMWQFYVYGDCPKSILSELSDYCGAKLSESI